MHVASSPIYAEVYEFLASAPLQDEILAFRPSEALLARLNALREAEKRGLLPAEEIAELDEWEQVEHLVRMVKLTTRKQMQHP